MYSKMVLLFQDGSHVESYEGAGRIMHAKWNHSSKKVYSYKDKYLCMYFYVFYIFAGHDYYLQSGNSPGGQY